MDEMTILERVRRWEDAVSPLAPLSSNQRDAILELSSFANNRPLPFQESLESIPKSEAVEDNKEESEDDGVFIDDDGSSEDLRSPPSSTHRRRDSFVGLESGRIVINSAQDFFKWYAKVEDDMEMDQYMDHHRFLTSLKQAGAHCHNLLKETDEALTGLQSLIDAHKSVSDRTKSLHDACEDRLAEQSRLCEAAELLESRLSYFQILDELTAKLNSSSISVHSESFVPTLVKLDQCIGYMKSNSQFKDTGAYLIRLEACLHRGLSMIRSFVNISLTEACDQVLPHVVLQGKSNELTRSPSGLLSYVGLGGSPSTQTATESNPPLTLDQAYPYLYARFRVNAPKIKALVAELESRMEKRESTGMIYGEIQGHYFYQRKRLLFPVVQALVQDSTTKHAQNKCAMVRGGCRLILNICQDELDIFESFFSVKKTGQLESYLEELCALLYDVYRPIFVHVNHLETLTELCIIMRVEILEDDGVRKAGPDLEPFTRMMTQLIEDVQERLIYRTHIYIKSDIMGYAPAAGDLAYPEKLIMMKSIAETLHAESEEPPRDGSRAPSRAPSVASMATTQSQFVRSHTGASAADLLGMWYPTVRRTLVCLSKLYRSLDKSSFQGLSQEALSGCIESLMTASEKIAAKHPSNFLDAQLFVIKHLLILREQIAPFQVDFVVKEMMLDFSKVKGAAMDFIQSRRVLSLNAPSVILEFILDGTPDVKESVVDSKRDVDLQLKRSCQSLISHSASKVTTPIYTFLGEVEKSLKAQRNKEIKDAFAEISDQEKAALMKEAFMEPEEVGRVVAEATRNAKVHLPSVLKSLRLYLANRDTEMILFRPVKAGIMSSFATLEKLLVMLFGEEERRVINCPSQEQLNMILSTVLASANTSSS